VELVEREASAVAAIGDQLYLVTRAGEPFKLLEEGDPFDLPVVTGINADNLARDREREIERIALGLEILRHYERVPMSKIHPAQEIQIVPGGEAVLTVGGKNPITLHLGSGPWRKKLLMAERVIGRLAAKGRVPGIVFLDNTAHPERVVVRMR
jgi:cell division protein FtsQ